MRLSQAKISELVNKSLLTADNVNWNRFTSIPWQELKPELLTEKQRSAVAFITFIEDHLPGYFAEYNKFFSIDEDTPLEICVHNRELYHFLVRWAQEEDRHAHVLANYQLRSGLGSPEKLYQDLAQEGRKHFFVDFTSPPQVFTYALLQEKATLLYYKQLHNAIQEPVLKYILRLLAKDEARHFAFFARVVGAYLEQFGEQVIPHLRTVLENFKMPLHNTLKNYWRWSLAICDAAGGYKHTDAYEDLGILVNKFADASTHSKAADLIDLIHKIQVI